MMMMTTIMETTTMTMTLLKQEPKQHSNTYSQCNNKKKRADGRAMDGEEYLTVRNKTDETQRRQGQIT